MIIAVKAVPREPTVFMVEGFELACANPGCHKVIKRFPDMAVNFSNRQRMLLKFVGVWNRTAVVVEGLRKRAFRQPGEMCPQCGGALEQRWHRVDIAGCDLNGECGCEWFQMELRRSLRSISKAERAMGYFRCTHIDAARDFALDVAIAGHEKHRLSINGNGRKEEHAP